MNTPENNSNENKPESIPSEEELKKKYEEVLKSTEHEKTEHIPTEKEIAEVFEKTLEGAEYKTIQKEEDEKGIYLWLVEIPPEEWGDYSECEYVRKGIHPHRRSTNTNIFVHLYKNKISIDGWCLADYADGEWTIR